MRSTYDFSYHAPVARIRDTNGTIWARFETPTIHLHL